MLQQTFLLAFVQLTGMMSPGPTTVLMLRNGGRGGRRYAHATALGITASTAIHVLFGAAGLGALLLRSGPLAAGLRYLGAAYLTYLGGRILWGLLHRSGARVPAAEPQAASGELPWMAGYREGFLTNLLNPKVTLLYLALFGQLAAPETPARWIYILAAVVIGQSLVYWLLFATLTSGLTFRRLWCRWNGAAEGLFGVLLVAFGIRLVVGG